MTSHQAQKWAWEEGIALGLLQELDDPDPPIDAFELAAACGLEIHAAPVSRAFLEGSVIKLNTRLPLREQHAAVSHEIGHWALQRAREWDPEWAATYVGMALLLPRRYFCRDLSRLRWDLRALYSKHIYCPLEMIAHRITTLRCACMSVWECGRLVVRHASPELSRGFNRVTPFERELADAVLRSGDAIEAGNLAWGVPDFDGRSRRVITICDAEQLDEGKFDATTF